MNYPKSSICDYVNLFFADAVVTSNEAVFTIPASAYLNNERGDYVLVSMVDGVYFANAEHSLILTIDNVINAYSTNASMSPVLGCFTNVTNETNHKHIFIPNGVSYLMHPNPSKITIKTFEHDLSAESITSNCYITLKFQYLSKNAVKEQNKSVAFTPAFPEPKSF